MTAKQFTTVTHVLFDMDGLLLDTATRYGKAINNLTQRYGKTYSFELEMKTIGRTDLDVAKLLITELELPLTVEQYIELIMQEYIKVFNNVPLMPGAEALVLHLHKHNIPMAVVTSSARNMFEINTKHLKEFFKLFEHILIASDDPEVKRGKPDPQCYILGADRFVKKPESKANVLVFEDAPAGVSAGISAGCQAVWVPDPRLDSRDMAKPTLTINSLLEFKPELFGLPQF